MRMNFPTGVLVAAVGAAVGFLAAVGTRDTGGEGRGDAGRGKAVTGSPGREEYQLSKLEQVLKQKGPGPNYRAHMERLTTEELRGLLRELSLTQLEQVHRNPYANNPPALGEAAEELYRREGLAALQWATGDGFIPDSPQGDLLRVLLLVAVAEDPAGAKPWVDAYQKALEGSMAGAWNPFIEQAIRAASSQGVDALLRLKEIYGVDVLGKADLTTGQLPADFDFKRLLQEFPQSHGLNATVRLWAAKDPEGAWKALREMDAENKWTTSRYATSLFTGMSQTMGEEAATKWLASRLDEVSGPYRDRLLFSLLNDQRMNYQVAEQVMAELPRDSDRVALAMGLVSPYRDEAPLRVLESIDSMPQRVEVLIGAAKSFSRVGSDRFEPGANDVNDYFEDIVTRLGLSPADRERVLGTLRTPQDPFGR